MFNKYFLDSEYRRLIIIDALITIVFAPIQLIFVCRWNLAWGISDMYFIFFLDVVDEIISQCFIHLPISVIFAKITPMHIEATSFALLAGISNFRIAMRGWIGSVINDAFVGVTREDLSDYWKLIMVALVCSFIPLFFIYLIPTKKQIIDLQARVNINNGVNDSQDDRSGEVDQTTEIEMNEITIDKEEEYQITEEQTSNDDYDDDDDRKAKQSKT